MKLALAVKLNPKNVISTHLKERNLKAPCQKSVFLKPDTNPLASLGPKAPSNSVQADSASLNPYTIRACTLALTPVDIYPPEHYDYVTGMHGAWSFITFTWDVSKIAERRPTCCCREAENSDDLREYAWKANPQCKDSQPPTMAKNKEHSSLPMSAPQTWKSLLSEVSGTTTSSEAGTCYGSLPS